jgi:hypothetical protein
MNVWIWGPPMWDILHSSAFALDRSNINIDSLVEPLRVILPCRYCRDSFVDFYKDLGRPETGLGLEWTFKVHNLVNNKLANQRLQAYAQKHGTKIKADINASISFDVVQKRLLVNSDELFTWKSISVVLLALAMSGADHTSLNKFIKALRVAIDKSRQPNANVLIDVLDEYLDSEDKRAFVDNIKYGKHKKYSELIRAGSCVSGTCK